MNEVDRTRLEAYLKQLSLPAFVKNYRRLAQTAGPSDCEGFLLALAEEEVAQRERANLSRRIRQAKFPVIKELAGFDFACVASLDRARVLALAEGNYIRAAEPVIMIGNPGLGKTHLAIALAVAACRQGRRVRFYTATGLVNELTQAQNKHRLAGYLALALKHDLIVLDELGFTPLPEAGAQLLFQFLSALHEKVALIVTTNLNFADWTQVFGDQRLTVAVLDRLTHHGHILAFTGESYRLRQRMEREAELRRAG